MHSSDVERPGKARGGGILTFLLRRKGIVTARDFTSSPQFRAICATDA